MAADPVIFDCGGSTRIKRMISGGVGAMNGLLDVDLTLNPPQSSDVVPGPFTHINVVSIDETGLPALRVNCALVPGDTFTITSDNGQKVVVAIDATARCQITLQGSPNNSPLVEAKQFKKRRRYVVANAGPIQLIAGTANATAFQFDAVAAKSIYVTAVLT